MAKDKVAAIIYSEICQKMSPLYFGLDVFCLLEPKSESFEAEYTP